MAEPVIVSSGGGGGGRTLETILILAALAVVGWLLYSRFAKKPAPVRAEADEPEAKKPPTIQDEGKIRIDSSVQSLLNVGRRAVCSAGSVSTFGKGSYYCRPTGTAPTVVVDTSSSPLSVAAAPATVPQKPLAQAINQLVYGSPANVTAPMGAVMSSQPVPPQQPYKPATSAISVAGRPSPNLIGPIKPPAVYVPPPVAPKPAPTPAAPKPVIQTTATAKPTTALFVKPLGSSSGGSKPASGGFTVYR